MTLENKGTLKDYRKRTAANSEKKVATYYAFEEGQRVKGPYKTPTELFKEYKTIGKKQYGQERKKFIAAGLDVEISGDNCGPRHWTEPEKAKSFDHFVTLKWRNSTRVIKVRGVPGPGSNH